MFDKIMELSDIYWYLEKRELIKSYVKAKNNLSLWITNWLDFKLRKPKNEWVYQFRINQKYRAFWTIKDYWDKKVFIVHKISDHQD